jgi:hypothetical protein
MQKSVNEAGRFWSAGITHGGEALDLQTAYLDWLIGALFRCQ